jgi:hypothetical protein
MLFQLECRLDDRRRLKPSNIKQLIALLSALWLFLMFGYLLTKLLLTTAVTKAIIVRGNAAFQPISTQLGKFA